EKDRQCRAVLRRHWPDVKLYEDVRDVGRANLAPVDLICGGFPCQDLSVAGRRAGLAGERSGLWWEFHRLVAELLPRWVLIENVPGLLSSNGGRDFAAVLHGLAQLGYWWTYRVLDARHFGVPQRRRRVFIVGHLGAPCPPEVLLEPESLCRDSAAGREARARVAGAVTRRFGGTGADDNDARGGRVVATLRAHTPATGGIHGDDTHVLPALTAKMAKGTGRPAGDEVQNIIADVGDTAPTLRAMPHDASHPNGGGQVAVVFHWQSGGDCRGLKPSPVVGALHVGQCPATMEGMQAIPRRLTPTECERLMGWPDGWTAWGVDERGQRVEMADGPRYRM